MGHSTGRINVLMFKGILVPLRPCDWDMRSRCLRLCKWTAWGQLKQFPECFAGAAYLVPLNRHNEPVSRKYAVYMGFSVKSMMLKQIPLVIRGCHTSCGPTSSAFFGLKSTSNWDRRLLSTERCSIHFLSLDTAFEQRKPSKYIRQDNFILEYL